MIFLKRWFGYTKTTFGGMHEYQEEAADMELIDAGDKFSILGELEGYWFSRSRILLNWCYD